MAIALDISGNRYGRLIAVQRSDNDARGRTRWLCKCDCGTDCVVRTKALRFEQTQSCGCLRAEVSRRVGLSTARENLDQTKHGHASKQTKTYNSWRSMLERCRLRGSKSYADYGGRGVQVCDRWLSFENFLADMGERPPGKTLDRYPDNDGNYEPGNCRWATALQQRHNRRDSRNGR